MLNEEVAEESGGDPFRKPGPSVVTLSVLGKCRDFLHSVTWLLRKPWQQFTVAGPVCPGGTMQQRLFTLLLARACTARHT